MVRIAWDAQTNAITYMFIDDPTFETDSELGVGGSCRIGKANDPGAESIETQPYIDWLISPQWTDTVTGWSGDSIWYAALRKENGSPYSAKIVGFVQSRYLKLKP